MSDKHDQHYSTNYTQPYGSTNLGKGGGVLIC